MKWYGDKLFATANKRTVRAMNTAALIVERDVKKSFGSGGSGYMPSKRGGKIHWSSAPDNPPNVDLGALRASMAHAVINKKSSITGFVGVDDQKLLMEVKKRRSRRKIKVSSMQPYGVWLELGTSKTEPRPFLRPALRRNSKKILNIFKKALR